MLFKVWKQPNAETILGYDWIEVLAVSPWWIKEVIGDDGEHRGHRVDHHYLCRTEHGITWLAGADLDPELGEAYLEEGQTVPTLVGRCHVCDEPAADDKVCEECGLNVCDDHATGESVERLCNRCAGL